jgi:PAS domain S-box-containing protein
MRQPNGTSTLATTKQQPTHDEFESSAQLAVLTELGIAAVVLDLDGTIRQWNPFAEELYGRSEQDMVGRSAGMVRLADHDAAGAWTFGAALKLGRWHGTIDVPDASGAPVRLDAHATLLCGDDGAPVGVLGALRAPDPRPPQDDASGMLVDAGVSTPPEWGYFEWDPASGHASMSDVLRWHVAPDGRELTAEEVTAAFSPEDLARAADVFERLCAGEADTATYTYRLQRADGSVGWLESHLEAVRAEDGWLIKIRGTTKDITRNVELTSRMQDAAEMAQSTIDSLAAQVAILDERGCIVGVNRAWRQFGLAEGAESDFVGTNYLAACAGSYDLGASAAAEGIRSVLAGERNSVELEYPCHSPTERRWFMLRITGCEGTDAARVVVMHEDVTALHEMRMRIAMQERMLNRLNVAVTVTDAQGRIVEWNEAAEHLYGWTAAEVLGQDPVELLGIVRAETGDTPAVTERVGPFDGEYNVRLKDGSNTTIYARMQGIADDDGARTGIVSVAIDISERKAFEREIVRGHSYMRAVTDSVGEGVFALDADGRVTYMNDIAQDMLGWSLEQLEGRVMHPITHSRHADGSEHPAEECPILRCCAEGKRVHVQDDVFIRADGSQLPVAYTASPLLTDAGIDGCVVVFADITERKAVELRERRDREHRSWVARVQEALADDGFELYGQPIIDLESNAVVQQELLIRMKPTDGSDTMISPGLFLPPAEQSGLITQIDRWVIDRSVELAATGVAVELNVSAASISDASLVDYIRRAIRRSGADPASLVFEITETTLISDEAAARAFVEALHRLGCRIALDDFGTGYGGFTYLKQLPIDYLKIDIEFVRDLKYDPASQRVVEAVVNLARGFGLTTVGEGVEDQETLDLLRELGVDRAQGFHIGRPAPLSFDDTQTPRKET